MEAVLAIGDFVAAFPWLRDELADRAAAFGWPQGTWLDLGARESPDAPTCASAVDAPYGWTHLCPTGHQGIWFGHDAEVLTSGNVIATSTREATVHELGHLVYGRGGAGQLIDSALRSAWRGSHPGRGLSRYAMTSLAECWAEATVAVNFERAWAAVTPATRHRLRLLGREVNERSDVALL